jgi:flagellar basal body rod protein FlgB
MSDNVDKRQEVIDQIEKNSLMARPKSSKQLIVDLLNHESSKDLFKNKDSLKSLFLEESKEKMIEKEQNMSFLQVSPESRRPSTPIHISRLEDENSSDYQRQNSVCRAKKLKYQPDTSIIKEESSRRGQDDGKSDISALKSIEEPPSSPGIFKTDNVKELEMMFGKIVHEFRQPINAIQSST